MLYTQGDSLQVILYLLVFIVTVLLVLIKRIIALSGGAVLYKIDKRISIYQVIAAVFWIVATGIQLIRFTKDNNIFENSFVFLFAAGSIYFLNRAFILTTLLEKGFLTKSGLIKWEKVSSYKWSNYLGTYVDLDIKYKTNFLNLNFSKKFTINTSDKKMFEELLTQNIKNGE